MHEVDKRIARNLSRQKERGIYIVNPYGTLQLVRESLANEKLKLADWRLATEEEIALLKERNGGQTMKKRIAPSLRGRPGKDKEHAFNDYQSANKQD